MKKLLLLIPFLLVCGCRGNNTQSTMQRIDASSTTTVTTITTINPEQEIIDKIEEYIKENVVSAWESLSVPVDFVLLHTEKIKETEEIEFYRTDIYRHDKYGYKILVYLTSVVDNEIQKCVFIKEL